MDYDSSRGLWYHDDIIVIHCNSAAQGSSSVRKENRRTKLIRVGDKVGGDITGKERIV